MTTQTVLLDIFDYGASTVTVTVNDPDTMVLTDTADSVTKNGVNGCRYAAVFTRVSVLAAGVYAVSISVNGIPGLLYCTLAGTDGETVVARAERGAVLDSASITAVQSGLATASALATTHALLQLTDTDVAAIEARLPYDPADQSAVEAAITAATSPLATAATQTTILARLGSWTGTGLNTVLGAFRALMAKAASLTPSDISTGTTFDNTTDSAEALRDRGDAAWITGSGAGGTTTIVTLQAVAGISPGVIVGPSEPLVIGDDYLTAMNRSVRINLLDADGDPAEVDYGTYALDDVGISIQLLLARSGKPSTVADLVGTCTFFPAVEEIPPYLIVEFTKTETVKAIPGPYDMQAEAIWNDGKVVTFAPYGQIQFVRNIRRS